jgi:hypothetical protein
MLAVTDLASQVGMQAACRAFAFNPGFVYRDRARRRGKRAAEAPGMNSPC